MRAAFGISFSCTTRITTVSSVLNLTTTYTPKNVYNKSTCQIYESKTYTTMYTCTLLTHNRKKWISKKLKPRKCSWLWYLNKIIMKTCILSETSIYTSKKNSHKNFISLSLSLSLTLTPSMHFQQTCVVARVNSWTELVNSLWLILVCNH